MKLILILAGMKPSKIVAFGAQKTLSHTLKRQRIQNESLFGVDFGPEPQLGHFYSKMTKERLLLSMAIFIGPC